MGEFWLWVEVVGMLVLAGVPLAVLIACTLRRASRKVDEIIREELGDLGDPDDHEDRNGSTPSGDSPDQQG